MRGGLAVRLVSLVFGLFLFSWGIVLQLESRLGLSPWDVLHQGIARRTPISFGVANIAVGVLVLALAWRLGGSVGIGTVANAVLVGLFIQLFTSFGAVGSLAGEGLAVRVVLLTAGILVIGPASALYIGANLGAGPRDTLMLVGSRRSGVRIGAVRATIELTALAGGIALGGTFGAGTVAYAFLVGPVVEVSFAALARSALAAPTPVSPELLPARTLEPPAR